MLIDGRRQHDRCGPSKRIPSLDGLRAISIVLVLCGHLEGTYGFYNNAAVWNHLGDFANFGVRVFFVISGYLITLLLLKETEKTGTISLKQFYVRRAFRIFPASYSLILIVTAMYYLGAIRLNRYDLLHAYTYTMNYSAGRSWWLGHLWSLSVEEQFYLLWPATLLFLGIRKGLRAAVVVVIVVPFVRLGTDYMWVGQRPIIGSTFQTIADTIATGCILAGYKDDLLRLPWFRRIIDSRVFFLIPLFALALNLKNTGRLSWFVFETLMNVAIALCICRVTTHTQDWAGKLLNWRPIVFVGVLSYSLYVCQQLFINRNSGAWPERFPQNLILACCAAMLCHYCIERPFLRLRDKKRSSHPVLAKTGAETASPMPSISVLSGVELALASSPPPVDDATGGL